MRSSERSWARSRAKPPWSRSGTSTGKANVSWNTWRAWETFDDRDGFGSHGARPCARRAVLTYLLPGNEPFARRHDHAGVDRLDPGRGTASGIAHRRRRRLYVPDRPAVGEGRHPLREAAFRHGRHGRGVDTHSPLPVPDPSVSAAVGLHHVGLDPAGLASILAVSPAH